jgi:hypothetical protein
MATATGQFESNAAVSCGLPSPAGIKPHLFVQKPENFIKASGVTSKAANGGHFKTGQRNVAWD